MTFKKQINHALFCLLVLTPVVGFSTSSSILKYESSEHVAAGDQVTLYFSSKESGITGASISLPNGLNLTYGQIVSMGDFYGVVGKPISIGTSDQDRRARFLAAFDAFARDENAITEMPKILEVIQFEKNAVDEGMKQGEKPEDIYARISDDDNRQWNCITGGSCDPKTWFLKPGRYLTLAKQDFDHFGENAWTAYQTGHQLAIETAIAAHQTKDSQQLALAYAMNGFACHFLSDRFASGHIRAPRVELPAQVTPSVLGSLLVHFMHDEENDYGLHLHNLRGDHWMGFGDEHYYDVSNQTNIHFLEEALQVSSDEIFAAYEQGSAPTSDLVENIIPFPDEIANMGTVDIAPLFYWDPSSRTLYRRTDTTNPQDRHWTSHWWGWSTLILLAQQHGLPALSQAELVQAGYGEAAIQYGLITDKNVLGQANQSAL